MDIFYIDLNRFGCFPFPWSGFLIMLSDLTISDTHCIDLCLILVVKCLLNKGITNEILFEIADL